MDAPAARRSLRLVALAIATLIGTAVLPVAAATASPDFSSLRRSMPYVPLFTQAWAGAVSNKFRWSMNVGLTLGPWALDVSVR